MAVNRVLTDDEKEVLKDTSRFFDQCEWAVRNFASYWTTDAQTGTQVGAVGYNKWAKNRQYSALVIYNGINDANISLTFSVLLKGMLLWDSAVTPFNTDTVIDYMIANGKFDELATAYVTVRTQQYIF